MNIKEFALKYWKQIGVAIFAIALLYPSCRPTPAPVVTMVKEVPATKATKKLVPTAVSEIQVTVPKAPLGKTPEIKVVKKEDGSHVQITEFKLAKGFFGGFGIYGNLSLLSGDIGLMARGPYLGRFGLDGLVGVKGAGLGISGKVLSNTALGVSYVYSYASFAPAPGLYISLGF